LIAASSNCGRVKSQPSTRTVFLLVLFLSVIVLLAWWLFFHREPSYRGVPVRAWVQQLKNTQNSEKNETFHVLLDIGPDCLPALGAELSPMDNVFTRTYARLWPKLPQVLARLFPRPAISRAERRATAAWALGQIGPAARPMTPALIKALDDPDDKVRVEAAQALRWVSANDPPVVAALARRLNDAAPMVRSRSAESLWHMAPESAAALGPLTQLLSDPDDAYHGALCLEQLGPLASNSIPALIEVVKRGVAGGRSQPKFKASVAAPPDPSAHNRAMAAKALGAIGVSSEEVLTALRNALDYPDAWVRQNAAIALGRLGTNSIFAMEALAFRLGDTNPPVMQEAALSLGAMGAAARPILPELTNLLGRLPEPLTTQLGLAESAKWQMFWLKSAVARAILQIDPDDTIALGVLLEQLDKDYYARRASGGTRFTVEGPGATAGKVLVHRERSTRHRARRIALAHRPETPRHCPGASARHGAYQ
jgi:hypothetical protein